jgi:hypothetical protein
MSWGIGFQTESGKAVAISVKGHATAGLFASLQGFSDSAASGGKAVVP